MTDVTLDTAAPDAPSPTTSVATARRKRPTARLYVAGAVLIGALVYLLVVGLGSSLNYFDTVDQALAAKAQLGTSTFRLEGVVVPGTIQRSAGGANFSVSEGSARVAVENTGSPPQLFQGGLPVVVVGHFASVGSTTFVSNLIMVKHSQDYIAAHPGRVRSSNGAVH